MTAKLLDFIKSAPPAPRVALLPDQRFFLRVAPVPEGATAAEIASQVELALETLSPFPAAQLYYGYFWAPGETRVLIFASYRKRFTTDQAAEWAQAELVAPVFAAFLDLQHEPATTLLIPAADGLTAIHWDSGRVPASVLTRVLAPEATDAERAEARDALVQAAGGSRVVTELAGPPEIAPSPDDRAFHFRAGDAVAILPRELAATVDVRDKGELTALRGVRARDLLYWRILAGCALLAVLLVLGELGVAAGRSFWLKAQQITINAQRPRVEQVMTANELAAQIEDLSNNRLLPLEMVSAISGREKRGSIVFTRIVASHANGLYTLLVDGQTSNSADLDVYRTTLLKLPSVASVDTPANGRPRMMSGGMTTFTLLITFKPDAIKPAT